MFVSPASGNEIHSAWQRVFVQLVARQRLPNALTGDLQVAQKAPQGLCGAGTRAGRVPTHRDARRARSKARPEESGRGRLRVCAHVGGWEVINCVVPKAVSERWAAE